MGFLPVKPFSVLRLSTWALVSCYLGWFLANVVAETAPLGPYAGAIGWAILILVPLVLVAARPGSPRASKPLSTTIRYLVLAVALAAHVRGSIVERVRVTGESMLPTYRPGDALWIEKWSVGLHPPDLSFPFGSPFRAGLVPALGWGLPPRGSVVVLRFPGGDRRIVKRVAALPGEDYDLGAGAPAEEPRRWLEIPADQLSLLGDSARIALLQGPAPRGVVPSHTLLVLGDNSTLSRDSRSFGFVPIFYIEGVAVGGGRPLKP